MALTDEQIEIRLTQADGLLRECMEALAIRARPTPVQPAPSPAPAPGLVTPPMAWGAKVSQTFRDRIRWICRAPGEGLFPYPDAETDLMTCIAWESGRSFSASVPNKAGSGAVGLIQFMPKTAREQLGTTTAALARMTAEDQLNYVYKYFRSWGPDAQHPTGEIQSLGDMYMAILWPAGVGKPDDWVLWDKDERPTTFRQNAGLDLNRDGEITKAECLDKLRAMRAEGLRPGNVG
ncbi:MAG TPA: hypothetical protein VFH89_04785 [Sphingomicrobium sp.]|nr:hypothetical protein [Sphingomicrobium sp.]